LYIGVADEADQIDILHVDDDESILDLSATFLEKNHDLLSIRKKLDTEEALDYDETTGIDDCIVPDYDMPSLNGVGFLEQVREPHPESTGRWTRSKRSSR
jgi:DNA-binding NtrC family response regulator